MHTRATNNGHRGLAGAAKEVAERVRRSSASSSSSAELELGQKVKRRGRARFAPGGAGLRRLRVRVPLRRRRCGARDLPRDLARTPDRHPRALRARRRARAVRGQVDQAGRTARADQAIQEAKLTTTATRGERATHHGRSGGRSRRSARSSRPRSTRYVRLPSDLEARRCCRRSPPAPASTGFVLAGGLGATVRPLFRRGREGERRCRRAASSSSTAADTRARPRPDAPSGPERLSARDWLAALKRAVKQFVADDCTGPRSRSRTARCSRSSRA